MSVMTEAEAIEFTERVQAVVDAEAARNKAFSDNAPEDVYEPLEAAHYAAIRAVQNFHVGTFHDFQREYERLKAEAKLRQRRGVTPSPNPA